MGRGGAETDARESARSSRRSFGLLSGQKQQQQAADATKQTAEAEDEATFAVSLFDGASHRLKMVDDIYIHMLDDASSTIVLQHAVALQRALDTTVRALRKKTERPKNTRNIASMYGTERSDSELAGTAAAAASAPDLSEAAATGSKKPRERHAPTEAPIAPVPRPPSGKKQPGSRRKKAPETVAAPPTPAAEAEPSDALAATLSDRDIQEADRAREKERMKLKDERNKALQATLKEKQVVIGEAAEKNSSLARQVQKLTDRLRSKESQLRSIHDLHRDTENQLLERVDHLEAEVAAARQAGSGDHQALALSDGRGADSTDAVAISGELQGALTRLMQAQEDLAASEAALVNSKKKVRVLKDKISLQERKAIDLEAAQEEDAEQLKAMQAKLSRAENKVRVAEARARKVEEEAATASAEALELQSLVHHAKDELKGRDEQGASLAAKLQKAVAAIGQKAEEMERLKALLAIAHAENEKAIELEAEVSKERRKALKCKKDAERAEAKLAASEAKLEKRKLEIGELRADLATSKADVALADQKLATAKSEMIAKDSVVDKAAVDTSGRLKALQNAEQEIRDLHSALDRHDNELAERDAKVAEAEEAVTAAWKFAKKGIKEVQAEAARQVAAVQATAQREVQKIQSDNVADEMLQASYTAVKEADAEAQKVKDTLEASVQEAERLRNTNVALLKHLDASRVEREQLTMQLRHCEDTLSKTFASVTEAAALKAELEHSQASVRAFRMRHAVAMTRMEGLEQQVRVLRDEEEKDNGDEFEGDDLQRKLAEENAKALKVVDGDRNHLLAEVRRWMAMEVDVDKVKGQKNKALEKARESDELSGRLQSEMIASVGHAALDKITSDIEVDTAKEAQIAAEEAQARAQALTDELNAETSQILEMLDAEKAGRSRLEESLQHQIADREQLMAALHQADGGMAGLKSELSERDEEKSSLQMELEESKALVSASHAREDALRKGMSDLRSVRVVDYILSRPDLCPANLVTHQPTDAGHAGGAAAAHAMVGAVRAATAAHETLTNWRQEKWTAGAHVRPTADEIALFAPSLGVDPATESSFLLLVDEAMAAPIANPWTERKRELEGELTEDRLYYTKETGEEQSTHPLTAHYTGLFSSLREVEREMNDSFRKMHDGLGATPQAEMVQEAWQTLVDDCLRELFVSALRRHALMRDHYLKVAAMIDADPHAEMSRRLRAERPGAKVRLPVPRSLT
eukprot:COSAG04_NODE_53_length_30631_cov_16.782261_4_plen_1220_part_00